MTFSSYGVIVIRQTLVTFDKSGTPVILSTFQIYPMSSLQIYIFIVIMLLKTDVK